MENINESKFLTINNTKLFTLIRGKDITNPILLILHGGSSQTANFAWFNKDLEKNFTVVYFDQRGEGRSSLDTTDPSTLTLENYIEDIHHLTTYLKNRFNKEKIYLLGHSMGTLFGINTIKKYSEDYISYIAVAQTADPIKSDNIAFDILEEKIHLDKNELDEITRITPNNITTLNIKRRTKEMLALGIKYRGMIYKSNIFKAFKILLLPIFLFKYYNFKDKKTSLTQHKERLIFYYENAPIDNIKKINVPIYFIHGIDDLVTNYNLAKNYYKRIKAPIKEFITFENSAHFPQFEEADKFNKLIVDKLIN